MATATKLELNTNEKSMNISSYRGMVGSLLYLTTSRPYIMFSTCLCARFQANPRESHLVTIKRIFRYLKGTPKLGIWYPRDSGFDLIGYSDADYAGCKIERKSTTGTCHFLGNMLVSWFSKKQNSVSTSTAEAEYIAAGSCCAHILWMRNKLLDYGLYVDKIPIFCDNTGAISITENPVQHSKTKHIDIKYHFIREHAMNGTLELHFVPSEHQLVDIFTKPLDESTFTRLVSELASHVSEDLVIENPNNKLACWIQEKRVLAHLNRNNLNMTKHMPIQATKPKSSKPKSKKPTSSVFQKTQVVKTTTTLEGSVRGSDLGEGRGENQRSPKDKDCEASVTQTSHTSRYGAILDREGADLSPGSELVEPIDYGCKQQPVIRNAVNAAQTMPGHFQRQMDNAELENLARNLVDVSDLENRRNLNDVFFREVVNIVATIMNDICNKYEVETQAAIEEANQKFTDGESFEYDESGVKMMQVLKMVKMVRVVKMKIV
ncbi:hypothetical protein AgCh_037917 [Apium graveolens]